MNKVATTLFCALLCSLVSAQEPKFSVSVSSDTILLGNYFELKFTIENTSATGFEPPDLHGFNIVSGPNTSTSMSIINGKVSQSSSYTYYLEPGEIGVYTIKPAYLTSGETALETPPIDILVVPNPEGILQRPHAPEKKFEPFATPPKPAPETPSRPRKKF